MSAPHIEILYFDGCPHVDPTVGAVREAMSAAGVAPSAAIAMTRITDEASAIQSRFLGSPTVRVDGEDVDRSAATRSDVGLACRVYSVDGHLTCIPPSSWIESALRARTGSGSSAPAADHDPAVRVASSCCAPRTQRDGEPERS